MLGRGRETQNRAVPWKGRRLVSLMSPLQHPPDITQVNLHLGHPLPLQYSQSPSQCLFILQTVAMVSLPPDPHPDPNNLYPLPPSASMCTDAHRHGLLQASSYGGEVATFSLCLVTLSSFCALLSVQVSPCCGGTSQVLGAPVVT